MLERAEDARKMMKEGQPVLGRGWKEVDAFEDLEDLDEYESDEEELYVVMDLGNGIDNKALLAENSYQLIGLDTPLPFFKLGNQVYQGEAVKMIGDEIIFGRIRNEQNPNKSDRPPWHSTNLRLHFRPVTLRDKPATVTQPARMVEQPVRKARGRKKKNQDVPDETTAQVSSPAPEEPLPLMDTSELSAFLASHGHSTSAADKVETGLDEDMARASLDAINEAGPSSPRPSSVANSTTSPFVITKAPALRRDGKKYIIDTALDLSIVNVNEMWKGSRFVVSKEVEDQLQPQTNEEHLQKMRERGWTTKELSHAMAGRPLTGQGTRPGRVTSKKVPTQDQGGAKGKGKAGTDAGDDLASDSGHDSQAGGTDAGASTERDPEIPSAPAQTPLFQLTTARGDGKRTKARDSKRKGKGRQSVWAKYDEAPASVTATQKTPVDSNDAGAAEGSVEEEDEPLVSIDDVDMTGGEAHA